MLSWSVFSSNLRLFLALIGFYLQLKQFQNLRYAHIPQQQMYQSNALKTFPKIICVGKNYLKHVIQMGGAQVPKKPVVFMKPWTSLSYQPKQLHLPISKIHRIDHQLELGVFISKAGSNIKKEDVHSHIGGYFIGIDFTDRDFQNEEKEKRLPWTFSKGQDNFCPISELIDKEIDPYSIELQFRVNGQTRQKDLTKNMHFKIDEMISYISQYIKFEEGDLLFTGTPDGVGPVKGGDRIQAFGRIGEKVIAQLQFEVTH